MTGKVGLFKFGSVASVVKRGTANSVEYVSEHQARHQQACIQQVLGQADITVALESKSPIFGAIRHTHKRDCNYSRKPLTGKS